MVKRLANIDITIALSLNRELKWNVTCKTWNTPLGFYAKPRHFWQPLIHDAMNIHKLEADVKNARVSPYQGNEISNIWPIALET